MKRMFGVAIPVYKATNTIISVVKSITIDDSIDVALFVDDHLNYDELLKDFPQVSIFYNEQNLGYQANWNQCLDWLSKFELGMIVHSDDQVDIHKIRNEVRARLRENISVIGFSKWQTSKEICYYELSEFIKQTGLYIDCSSIVFVMSNLGVLRYRTDVLACDEYLYIDILKSGRELLLIQGDVLKRRLSPEQAEYHDLLYNASNVVKAVYQQIEAVGDKKSKDLLILKLCRVAFRGMFWQLRSLKLPSSEYLRVIYSFPIKLVNLSLIRFVLSDLNRMIKL